jgi:catechol 2,3-dioxygenase-like lactoylglutathione lyase family enzyme
LRDDHHMNFLGSVTLVVNDYDKAITYYTGTIGFELVEDAPLAADRPMAAGVTFEAPPRREHYGTVAFFQDLYGNRWDLIQPSAPAR